MSGAVVWFLRHGKTEGGARYWGRTDVALAADGLRQMEEATANLAVDRIVTSPLQRCRTFAEHLSERRGISCHVELRLVEMDFGAWDGRAAHDIFAEDREALERFWRDPLRHAPPGAEPLAEVAARLRAACADLCTIAAKQRVLAVTHGGPIRVALCLLAGRPLERVAETEVPHASLHMIDVSELARTVCA